jgi:probable rRNA maturation factor
LKQGKGIRTWTNGAVIVRKRVPALTAAQLAAFVARAKRAVKLRGGISVLVTGSHEMRTLNRRFRGKNCTTDVLSFSPAAENGADFAGDLAVSAELAAANGRRLGHSAAGEVKILVLHGLLHLAGYDHEQDDGEMASREEHLRKALGLPAGLIERNGQAANLNGKAQPAGPRKRRSTAMQRPAKSVLARTR